MIIIEQFVVSIPLYTSNHRQTIYVKGQPLQCVKSQVRRGKIQKFFLRGYGEINYHSCASRFMVDEEKNVYEFPARPCRLGEGELVGYAMLIRRGKRIASRPAHDHVLEDIAFRVHQCWKLESSWMEECHGHGHGGSSEKKRHLG